MGKNELDGIITSDDQTVARWSESVVTITGLNGATGILPFGTWISNRALLPQMPVSWIVIPVMPRISLAKKRPSRVFAVTFLKYLLFLIKRHTYPVIFNRNYHTVR